MFTNGEAGNAGAIPGTIVDLATKRLKNSAPKRYKTRIEYDLADLPKTFLEARQRASDPKPIGPKTVRSYRQALAYFESALSAVKWEEEISTAVSNICDERLASGTINKAGLNVYLRGTNSFLTWCHEVGFLRTHVKVNLLVPERRRRPKTLSGVDIEWWKAFKSVSMSEQRTKFMALLILDSGLRAEECIALQECDIAWNASRLWVGKGKGGANREAPLSTDGKKFLRQFLTLTIPYRSAAGATPVFLAKTGNSVTYRNSLRDLKKLAARAGTPWVSWHSFRRTFATQYLRNGGLLTDLQQILGHKDIRTTILYVGDGIDEIAALHDQISPLARTGKRTQKSHLSPPGANRVSLPGRSRKW
jgi:integrase/recombinase XerD